MEHENGLQLTILKARSSQLPAKYPVKTKQTKGMMCAFVIVS